GEDPTIEYGSPLASSKLNRYMYGLGLVLRKTRYTSRALASQTISKRRETTTWNTSPSTMASLARSRAFRYSLRSHCSSTLSAKLAAGTSTTDMGWATGWRSWSTMAW